MFNSKHSKSSLGNAFMASAIILVLVMGSGYSPMQSFGQGFDALPGFDIANKFGQSADCAGMLNSCGNDNSVQNPPEPNPPTQEPTCEEAVEVIIRLAAAELTIAQLADLEIALLDRCEDGASAEDLVNLLIDSEFLSPDTIRQIIEELDLDIAAPNSNPIR